MKRNKGKETKQQKNEKSKTPSTYEDGFYKDRKERHFRGKSDNVNNKGKVHPKYIIGKEKEDYYSLGLTHDKYKDKKKKHSNHELDKNPNSSDKNKAYMKKQIEKSNKNTFGKKKLENLKLSEKDDDYVDTLIEKKRKYNQKK